MVQQYQMHLIANWSSSIEIEGCVFFGNKLLTLQSVTYE